MMAAAKVVLLLCTSLASGKWHQDKWFSSSSKNRDSSSQRESVMSALAVVGAALESLEKYYNNDVTVLSRAVSDATTEDFQLRTRLVTSALAKKKFVMAVVGGSTASGEHVWRSTAWPMVLRGKLKPVFEKLGADFELRNQAKPHRPEFPDNLCLTPVAGRDVDVLLREWRRANWDQGLFFLQPGEDPAGFEWPDENEWVWNRNLSALNRGKRVRHATKVRSRDLAAFEVFLRTALLMKSQPTVHIVAMDPDGGDNSSTFRHALTKGGILHNTYRKYDINFFSAFGAPFEHLRKRFLDSNRKRVAVKRYRPDLVPAAMQPYLARGAIRKNCSSLVSCPIHPRLQDGHHVEPAKFGFDPADHPQWAAMHSHPGDLFFEGRLGILGHELVGNQLAYYYLRILNETLLMLAKSPQLDADVTKLTTGRGTAVLGKDNVILEKSGRPSRMPPPVFCGGLMCPEDGRTRPLCAYSSLPKSGPLDVGDLIANSTGVTRWRNVEVEDVLRCDLLDPRAALQACGNRGDDSKECFEYHAACSHHGAFQTRAFEGYSGSGALQLDVDFPKYSRCAVLIAEPIFRAKKPLTMANWFHELKVVVEGSLCTEPACRIIQGRLGSSAQSLFIDLTKIEGCRQCKTCWTLQPVHIDLHVDPLTRMAPDVCGLASTGKCVPVGRWKHYDLGCARKPQTDKKTKPSDDSCWRPLMTNVLTGETTDVRNPQLVKLAVSTVVAF